jgi:hypothetical protein
MVVVGMPAPLDSAWQQMLFPHFSAVLSNRYFKGWLRASPFLLS